MQENVLKKIRSRVLLTDETKHNPLITEALSKEFVTTATSFLSNFPQEKRKQAWQVLLQETYTLQISDESRRKKIKKVNSTLKSELIAGFNFKKRFQLRTQLKELSQSIVDSLDPGALLFSDEVIETIGTDSAPEFVEQYLPELPSHSEEFYAQPTGKPTTLVINESFFGTMSTVALEGKVISALKNETNPFESSNDDEFYKLALLCKVHGILDQASTLSEVLVSLVKKRAVKMQSQPPRFISELKEPKIELEAVEDELIKVLKHTANTSLSVVLKSRESHGVAEDNLRVSEGNFAKGRTARSIAEDQGEIEVSKQLSSQQWMLSHKARTEYKKQLLRIIALSSKTGAADEKIVLDSLQTYLRQKREVLDHIQTLFTGLVIELSKTSSTTEISTQFIQQLKATLPEFYQLISDSIPSRSSVEATATICLLIQETLFSLETTPNRDFTTSFNTFVSKELNAATSDSLTWLPEEMRKKLQVELKDLDISFDKTDQSHLTPEAGVVLLSSSELDQLKIKLEKVITQTEIQNVSSTESGNSIKSLESPANILSYFLNNVLTISIAVVLWEYNQNSLNPKEIIYLESMRNVLLAFGAYSSLTMIRTPAWLDFLRPKVKDFTPSSTDITRTKEKIFTKGLLTLYLLSTVIFGTSVLYKDNKAEIQTFFKDTYLSALDFIDSMTEGDGPKLPDFGFSNEIPRNAGSPTYRMLPANYAGYTLNGGIIDSDKNGIFRYIEHDQTPEYEQVFQQPEAVPDPLISAYADGETLFTLANQFDIDLVIANNQSDRLLVENIANTSEFYTIPGYIPERVLLSERDLARLERGDEAIMWSPLTSLTLPRKPRDTAYVLYRKIGSRDAEHFENYITKNNSSDREVVYQFGTATKTSSGSYDTTETGTNINPTYKYSDAFISHGFQNALYETLNQNAEETLTQKGYVLPDNTEQRSYLTFNFETGYESIKAQFGEHIYPVFIFEYKPTETEYYTFYIPYGFENDATFEQSIYDELASRDVLVNKIEFQSILEVLKNIEFIPNTHNPKEFAIILKDSDIEKINATTDRYKIHFSAGPYFIHESPYMTLPSFDNSIVLPNALRTDLLSDTPPPELLRQTDSTLGVIGPLGMNFVPSEAQFNTGGIPINSSDPELSYTEDLLAELEGNASMTTLEKLKYIQAELKARGLQYESGSQTSSGTLESVIDMLRVNPETGHLINPDQVCNGMSAMVYTLGKLHGLDIVLLSLNVKNDHTSYGGNASSNHMVIMYKENGYWKIFEATLPDYAGDTLVPKLPVEFLDELMAEMNAETRESPISTLSTLLLLSVGVTSAVGQLIFTKKSKKDSKTVRPTLPTEELISPEEVSINPKVAQLFKPLGTTEVTILAHLFVHSTAEGNFRVYSDENSERAQNPLPFLIEDVKRYSVRDTILELTGKTDDASRYIAASNLQSELLPTANTTLENAKILGWRKRIPMLAREKKTATEYTGFLELMQQYQNGIKHISRRELLDEIRSQITETQKNEIIFSEAKKKQELGDSRTLDVLIADLRRNRDTAELLLLTAVQKKFILIRNTLDGLRRL